MMTKSLTDFKFEDLERGTEGFAEHTLLGRGSYGSVYKASLPNGKTVAVKRASNNSSTSNELAVLSNVQCRHVVNLLGSCNRMNETLLVVEFMENGTLYDALHSTTRPLCWPLRIRIALQVAQAVAGLHTADPQIIHRDIKSCNVLIDSKWNARLGDFGLALRGEIGDIMCTPAGTLGYFDPRYEKPEQVSTKIDVFSFGVLLLEIISGRPVIDAQHHPSSLVRWALPLIKQGKLLAICDPRTALPKDTKALKKIGPIAAKCVRLDTSRRPSIVDVVHELSHELSHVLSHSSLLHHICFKR